MKKIGIAAVVIAAMILGGCSETSGNSSDSSQSSGNSLPKSEAPVSAANSSGGAPALIAPNFSDIVSATQPGNSAAVPVVPVEESDVRSEVEFGGDVVPRDETLYVQSGEVYYVRQPLLVEDGAKIVVEDGGVLNVSGEIELSGEIVLLGGKLVMSDHGAYIYGSGSVTVTEEFDSIDCEIGTIKAHIAPPERKVTNGVTTVGGIVVANKAITLPPEFGSHLSLDEVEPEVYEALAEMNANSDHWYQNKSGYRSYWDQKAIFQNYCDMYGYEEADTFSSQAGHSEHQTGLTMDLDDFEESYGATPEGIWLAENCWRYGFIIRYPKGKEHITGYTYEPWHVRWLGKSTAKLVFDSGLTLEEFLDVEGGTTVID